jgi:6-phosphogluconate dehydrogenase
MTGGISRDLGLVGLGTMGANLARNFADHGTTLALWDPAPGVAAKLADELRAQAASDLAGLVAALGRPRAIMLMVPAGEAVDASIAPSPRAPRARNASRRSAAAAPATSSRWCITASSTR